MNTRGTTNTDIPGVSRTHPDYGKFISSKLLMIDSRNRDNDRDSTASFTVRLHNPIEYVTRLRVVGAQVPNTDFVISSALGNNKWWIVKGTQVIALQIEDNSYSIQELIDYFNEQLNITFPGEDVVMSFNETTGKTSITVKQTFSSSTDYIFFTDPNGSSVITSSTLGSMIGFLNVNKIRLLGGRTYVAGSLPRTYGDNLLIVNVNDLETVSYPNKSLNQEIIGTAVIEVNTEKNSIVFGNHNILKTSGYYFTTPTKISKIDITLYTTAGLIPNLQQMDSSFLIEVEYIRSSLYHRYYSSFV